MARRICVLVTTFALVVSAASTARAAEASAPPPTELSTSAGYRATLDGDAVVTANLSVPVIDCTRPEQHNGIASTVWVGDSLIVLLNSSCDGTRQTSVVALTERASDQLRVRAGDLVRCRVSAGAAHPTTTQVVDTRTGARLHTRGDPISATQLWVGLSATSLTVPFVGARFSGVGADGVALAELPGLTRTLSATTQPLGSSHVVITARPTAIAHATDFTALDARPPA